jgi:hypothetical protein
MVKCEAVPSVFKLEICDVGRIYKRIVVPVLFQEKRLAYLPG